ncbi:MAG: prepilin-type N-terminal cleavage/methylation domain-containing protein [Verrucomicrobiota bacterium]
MKFNNSNFRFPAAGASAGGGRFSHRKSPIVNRKFPAFSLIEILVVVALLSLIVVALMAVFSSTQRAFRSGVTQTDLMEGGRATVDLVVSDLFGLTPGGTNFGSVYGVVNFQVTNNASYSTPLVQPLSASVTTAARTNLLQQVFVLNRLNTRWWGVGYAVAVNPADGLYALYRMTYPVAANGTIGTNNPAGIRPAFNNFFAGPTNGGSHLINGVVNFSVRAYDKNGYWIRSGYTNFAPSVTNSVAIYQNQGGEACLTLYGSVAPAAVDLDLAVVEDRALARAESFPTFSGRTNYLSQQSGAVHVFRQRVIVPNVDRTAYQ